MKKTRLACILTAVLLLFVFAPLSASAETRDFDAELWGMHCQMYGGGYNKAYFNEGSNPKDKLVFYWIRVQNDYFFSNETITYDYLMELADNSFATHSDLKSYLKQYSGKGYGFKYNESAGTIKFEPTGGAGGFTYTLKPVKNNLKHGSGYMLCKWMKGKKAVQNVLIRFESGAMVSFTKTSKAALPETGFTMKRDNNNFINSDSASFERSGFQKIKGYPLDRVYYNDMVRKLTKSQRKDLDKEIAEKWEGSCYGIASTMALVYNKQQTVSGISTRNNGTYYSMDFPYKDRKLLNNITYCQLGQSYSGAGSQSDASLGRFVRLDYGALAETMLILSGYSMEDFTPSVFLEKMVANMKAAEKNDKVLIFAYNDHAILATGYDYDKKTKKHIIYLYDENTTGKAGTESHITEMEIADDYTSAKYTVNSGNYYISDIGHDLGITNVYRMNLIDPERINWYGNDAGVSGSAVSETTFIKCPLGSSFTVTNAEGESLHVRPVSEDSSLDFDGDMELSGYDMITLDDRSYQVFTVDNSDSFTVDEIEGLHDDAAEITVSDEPAALDIRIGNGDSYAAVTTTDIESATFESDGSVSIAPKGKDFRFDAFIPVDSAQPASLAVTGSAGSQTELSAEGDDVLVTAEAADGLQIETSECWSGGASESAQAVPQENGYQIDGSEAIQLLSLIDLSKEAVQLDSSEVTYNGAAQTPAVKVSDLTEGTDYQVEYLNNVDVGTATVKITATGNSRNSTEATFDILPKGTSVKKLKKAKKAFTVTWKKQTEKMAEAQITGYQIRYSTKSSMAGSKTVTVNGFKKASKKIGKLKAKTKYYVQIRTFMNVDGKQYCSAWSGKQSVKVN